MSSDIPILETKTGKGTIAAFILLIGALGGAGLPYSQAGSSEKVEHISEQVMENKQSIAVMGSKVLDNTETLDDIQAGVSDNSEKLNQLIGLLRRQGSDD